MNDPELLQLAGAIDRRCRLRGEFVLRSGMVAREYFDKYAFESNPALLRRVVDRMAPLLPADADVLGGLELGGVPLATMLSSVTGVPAAFVRKHAKEYGTRRLAEGCKVAGQSVVLVEDVVTTGGAVVQAATALRDLGATVSTAVCAIDRSDPDGNALAAHGIELRAVLTKRLLDAAV